MKHLPPAPDFAARANAADPSIYARAAADPEAYWADWASQLTWIKKWRTVLSWDPPHAQWFTGGRINASYNCLDRHPPKKTALIWEGEPGDTISLTYGELLKKVCQCANALVKLGVTKGDVVAVYLPLLPELIIATLACARIGAVHNVVFGGLGVDSLHDRISDSNAKLLITADFGWRRGKKTRLKEIADQAVLNCPSIEHLLVVSRQPNEVSSAAMTPNRDLWWNKIVGAQDTQHQPAATNAEDPLFVLYTSGTTGKPKGILHTTGGYLTGAYATSATVLDLKPEDIYWCTADIGWITGHSYVMYGPLMHGSTVLIYEGALDWPRPDRMWELVEKHKTTILYTAPTTIRACMQQGDSWPRRRNLDSLRLLGTVGEPISPRAWRWYYTRIGHSRCPVVDTWWQTETGAIMISTLPGLDDSIPGTAGKPLPGISAAVVDDAGQPTRDQGLLAITKPWPSMARTILNDDKAYRRYYWSKWDAGTYFTGDGAVMDNDGYIQITGRVDDTMNIAGHRITTAEVENALASHANVAEAAAVSKPDQIKGEAIVAFAVLRDQASPPPLLQKELTEHVARKIGRINKPQRILFINALPKTRSGKIMRRLLKDIIHDRPLGDTTALADPGVVESLQKTVQKQIAHNT